jgi:hypothetical protein
MARWAGTVVRCRSIDGATAVQNEREQQADLPVFT